MNFQVLNVVLRRNINNLCVIKVIKGNIFSRGKLKTQSKYRMSAQDLISKIAQSDLRLL